MRPLTDAEISVALSWGLLIAGAIFVAFITAIIADLRGGK